MYRLLHTATLVIILFALTSCGAPSNKAKEIPDPKLTTAIQEETEDHSESQATTAMLLSPKYPKPGEQFRVMAVGSKKIRNAKIKLMSPTGPIEAEKTRSGEGLPYWQIASFQAGAEGAYHLTVQDGNTESNLDFTVTGKPDISASNSVWKTEKGWDAASEALFSAWINALFQGADERASWTALHEVTQNRATNFLHNHLSLNEDDENEKNRVLMQPDCADNPFYFRAYFAWKLGLPFGYHECDRGYLGKAPGTGRWVTNEANVGGATPVRKFNTFVRMVMNGVHSGTARTYFKNEEADYYPVPLTRESLRPGVVYADPYGHTLVLIGWLAQTNSTPGVLLSVDAQPDGTVGIKRFWKGNFLFNTSEVVGEPGFKAFRPMVLEKGSRLLTSEEINAAAGMIPFSLQQKGMEQALFYQTMERIINPKPLDPEMALLDLVKALHEQLIVRVTSVSNGETYMQAHPGEVIGMPGSAAGVFQAGGQWENFSTPNRDLRLLIAMDAVLDFPDKIVKSPEDFKLPLLKSPEQVKKELEELLNRKLSELTIAYTRTNGTEQTLTMGEILKRRDAFEMAYNPNDGIEIRWGAPEGSEERSTCKRKVPSNQLARMNAVRVWFNKRLHPPT